MNPTQTLTRDEAFFFKHAGYSFGPDETEAQGATRGAVALAKAEHDARNDGFYFVWSIDPDQDSRSFSKARPYWSLWQCVMYRPRPGSDFANIGADVIGSLSGVDFGRDGEPHGNPYKRVVEAELALEYGRS